MSPMQLQIPDASATANLLYRPGSFFERLDWRDVFARPGPVEVELGCGDSTFLAEWAGRHPESNFLGVERLMGRIRKLDRKGRRRGLHNLRGLRIEAGYCLEWLLPLESVRALHVYFPDPWPKRKHWHKRLVNESFPALAARILEPAGRVYLRTDDADYFEQMLRVFAACPLFETVETPPDLGAVLTDFEREFLQQGKATRRAACQRRGASAAPLPASG